MIKIENHCGFLFSFNYNVKYSVYINEINSSYKER